MADTPADSGFELELHYIGPNRGDWEIRDKRTGARLRNIAEFSLEYAANRPPHRLTVTVLLPPTRQPFELPPAEAPQEAPPASLEQLTS